MLLWIKTSTTPTAPVRRNRPIEVAPAPTKKKAMAFSMGRFQMSRLWIGFFTGLGVLILLAAVHQFQQEVRLSAVSVKMIALEDNSFLNEERILESMGWVGGVAPLGEKMKSLQLAILEDSLARNPFVERVELYKNIQGVLHAEVAMRKPVVRLMNNSGVDVYMDASGTKFPTSTLHSANVLLLRGDFEESVADTFSCETIPNALPVIRFIADDPYWNAYFSEAFLDSNGELLLYPRMESLEIEFGHPMRIEEKFRDLRVFLDQVMVHSNRPRFKRVSLKYQGQVVATKR